jgi:hypothetical protein
MSRSASASVSCNGFLSVQYFDKPFYLAIKRQSILPSHISMSGTPDVYVPFPSLPATTFPLHFRSVTLFRLTSGDNDLAFNGRHK